MTSIYEVTVEQDQSATQVYRPAREVFVVSAVNAEIAVRKALKEARGNGFLKSRPLEVTLVSRVVREFT